jgi:sortase (surface protein transpeptidase)
VSADGVLDIRPSYAPPKVAPLSPSPQKTETLRDNTPAAHHTEKAAAIHRPARQVPSSKAEYVVATPDGTVPQKGRFRLPNKQTAVLYGMAGVVFVIGLAVSLSGLRANHRVATQVGQAQQQTGKSVADNEVPSTTKLSATTVANYAASPNVPKYLDIPKFNVHTRVLSEGVTKSGQMQVPWNIYDTGWYNASSQPGQAGGMLIDGHSGLGAMHGVFYRLNQLAVGDLISIIRGDNTKFTYAVAKVQTVDTKSVDMASMLVSADTAKPGLNLITCTGDQIPGTTELNKRVQVYAVQQ